jgi:uncharacterized protein
MVKGQIIAGDFSKVIMRVKSHSSVELGELLVIDCKDKTILLQVFDLVYASQISQQNLEMVSGMNLEEDASFPIVDAKLRNYKLAYLKPILMLSGKALSCKELPPFFSKVREIQKVDLKFITTPENPTYFGNLRSGSKIIDFDIFLPGKEVFSHHVLIPASTGKGKSNLMSTILWDSLPKDFVGMLVLDPHDEYYGRSGLGLKDHPLREKMVYYTPVNPPPGARTLKINLATLKPEHFSGAITLSDPQRQCLYAYYRKFSSEWIKAIMEERKIEGIRFHEDTIAVVKRKLISLLQLDVSCGMLSCQGIFDSIAGENTIRDICRELEKSNTVIIDTSFFSGALEIMVGGMIASEMLNLYRYYKKQGKLKDKPVVSIVLEEAPRVLGKKVLEQGTNIFDTIAREGRKFQVGLVAITQLPSEIPKTILANMNTKIILGLEMGSERQAVIESAAQDLSNDQRTIASLDKGEALLTSTFTRFAVPLKIPFFPDFVKQREAESKDFDGPNDSNGSKKSNTKITQDFIGVGM